MNLQNILSVVAFSAVLISCGQKTFDANKNSMVVMSGPYSKSSVLDEPENIYDNVYQKITGETKPVNRTSYLRTLAVFNKMDGSGEKLSINVSTQIISKLPGAVASPGIYSLSRFAIGHLIIDYNYTKCGHIAFQVNPNEIVYIGSLRPAKGADVLEKKYNHFIPRFKQAVEPNYDMVRWAMGGDDDKNDAMLRTKQLVTRIPVNNMASPPIDCFEESSGLW